MNSPTVLIDTISVPIGDEENLLELIRMTGIELPTFCYSSEISVYGACRMCMVEVEGKGLMPACSTAPEDGMIVRTNTKQIRNLRKIIIELMLASHDRDCITCHKSYNCRLQSIAKQLDVSEVRFKQTPKQGTPDLSSDSIMRDPSKCVLCGDCVRVCDEIQSVQALNFAYRGSKAHVVPAFDKGIGEGECVNCGQCVRVCPVGAITIMTSMNEVWKDIYDSKKTVVAQIAPAVRVAMGDVFEEKPGALTIGKIISALRRMGFNRVYDTCFAADMTIVEEGKEFLERYGKGEKLPLFTSCCPAWVKFAEQFYPDLLDHLSSCKSPQQMFGSLCKDQLAAEFGIPREDLVIVSIMPCTAKKFEARLDKFKVNGNPDVDHVLTPKELALMIQESGIQFDKLEVSSFDMPFGFATGGGVIFGASGGVSEAVLRSVAHILEKNPTRIFKQFRGDDGVKTGEIEIGGNKLRLAVVSGLANARKVIEQVKSGEAKYDLIEVMACRGGCVNGGGQFVHYGQSVSEERAKSLYDNDRMLQLHASDENPYLQRFYSERLTPGTVHKLLHTTYQKRK